MILPPAEMRAEAGAPVVIIGGGACGLVAALAVRDAGLDPLVIERDRTPSGSTALSSGLVPAAATAAQARQAIADAVASFVADIVAKAGPGADPVGAARAAAAIAPALDWLEQRHAIPFHVLDGFLYPGHRTHRMHAVPERTGAALMTRLLAAADAAGVTVLTEARATALFAEAGHIRGLRVERPDGTAEDIEAGALILACNGFGGAPDLVRAHIPEAADALWFGHPGNQGDALRWGQALGAATADLGAWQGHGNVAHPHGALITWALLMEGGIQVNAHGDRFHNEHDGYSESALRVLRQPGGIAWTVFDDRLHALGLAFEDYRQADAAGAIRTAPDAAALAATIGLPPATLAATLAEAAALAAASGTDRFGRTFHALALQPPYRAVRVTGALFHTQGGLVIDDGARVLGANGTLWPNLFAGGGAARGVSGAGSDGYLSGNGLLTAIAYGRLAGVAASTRGDGSSPSPPGRGPG